MGTKEYLRLAKENDEAACHFSLRARELENLSILHRRNAFLFRQLAEELEDQSQ